MTILTIEIPDDLMVKLESEAGSVQEVIVDLLKRAFDTDLVAPKEQSSKAAMIHRLEESGYLAAARYWADPVADEWKDLSEEEKKKHLDEVDTNYLADSAVSRYIIENRR